ncbi:MAG: hypothetical protein HYZ84_04430 [Candidatus Omnitrophica bacterium]|nr:hypothetical protein [Candidatus Omnitrophota bacterium]
MNYTNAPGFSASPPPIWPSGSKIVPAENKFTLLMLAHPHCPCTRASVSELEKLMAHAGNHLSAYVVFMQPEGLGETWRRTDLWGKAGAIPGVHAVVDEKGLEAKRFRVQTSGQTLLYDEQGKLLFRGGITSARGHAGDNQGVRSILAMIHHKKPAVDHTPVFGCSLFNREVSFG